MSAAAPGAGADLFTCPIMHTGRCPLPTSEQGAEPGQKIASMEFFLRTSPLQILGCQQRARQKLRVLEGCVQMRSCLFSFRVRDAAGLEREMKNPASLSLSASINAH